jgi:hypothetical protein
MPDAIEFLMNRLRDEGEKSIQFFLNISPEKWESTVYTDGSHWTVRQVLSHFAQSESSLCRLVEQIVNGGTGTPENFDLNAYNEYKVSSINQMSISDLISLYRHNRERTIKLVSGLTEDDLSKKGRHPFLGVATLLDIIKLIYRHNQIHIREIRQVLG